MDSMPITELLRRTASGDRAAEEQLVVHLYPVLRRIARGGLVRWSGSSTAATGLVHEVYLRLLAERNLPWPNRRYFFRAFSRCARERTIDRARRRGRRAAAPLTTRVAAPTPSSAEVEVRELRERLTQLERVDPRAARAFGLHYLEEKTIPEMVEILGHGHAAIERHLRFARVWLRQRMYPEAVD